VLTTAELEECYDHIWDSIEGFRKCNGDGCVCDVHTEYEDNGGFQKVRKDCVGERPEPLRLCACDLHPSNRASLKKRGMIPLLCNTHISSLTLEKANAEQVHGARCALALLHQTPNFFGW
jgi:hypothetical protein